ncbi:helix-turn-helix transcriptional regulator [Sinanaerobacter sp. ZZT-01]|uniref:helix-turn-helix domain-containing protein n=1 Tax=Sinanaerobacter sp. ZZT-01 TaxID=3111540 RepID=UPI002D765CC3|nr:helix-turn-helix transcriptional regulator [Sinanaerobacter sp. ZZT-01]WRR92424.1 helix-turn-helix transcriptional regulator [Sinanaerobacter sp. ZZT-01]
MNSIELGKRIKEARIAKKMTQSELVGDFITRNMLSQIENGSATPSIKTLAYLSDVLEVPLNELMPSPTESALSQLTSAKRHLSDGENQKVIEMENTFPPELSDEFSALLSYAYRNLAKKTLEAEQYLKSAQFAQKAIEFSAKGLYANDMVKSESILLLKQSTEEYNSIYSNL